MAIHQFELWDKHFAVDRGSGNFFEIDQVCADALGLLQKYHENEVKLKLSSVYPPAKVIEALKNISALRKKDLLFSCGRGEAGVPLKRRITDLTLNIVNSCNLRCRYCWNNAGSYGRSAPKIKLMDEKVAFRAIDVLLKESSGAKDIVVDFYGGEPLLNFDLIRAVISHCRKIESRAKTNFRFLLATNGTLLTKDRGEFLIDNKVDIAVSLDGSRKIQNLQRPFPGGKGSFDLITGNLKKLSVGRRRKIVGRATFTPYSTDVISTFKFLRKQGFDRIEVCESENAGYGLKTRNRFFFSGASGLRRLKSLYDELAGFYVEEILKGRLNYENTYFNRFFKQLSRLYHIQSIVGACSAGFSLIAVDIDGSVYPCTAFVGVPRFSIGTVNTGIQENKLKKFFSNKVSSSAACSACWANKICRGCGSCYNLNYFSNNNAGNPDPYYCELFRHKTKLMMAMIARIAEKDPGLLDEVLIPEYYAARGKRRG